ncbi:Uncharacterised protein (plasmid) [Mesomycoplasma conjunctivae]|nr:Uncharacterised protein [Mycoplasmopsis fermentans]VEU67279.1 Uncharacterised protein [Mesomycoplasma conjunctivae]
MIDTYQTIFELKNIIKYIKKDLKLNKVSLKAFKGKINGTNIKRCVIRFSTFSYFVIILS